MPVVVTTDEELDRLIRIRLDQKAPMPKDIAFGLVKERRFLASFERYGLHDHPFVVRTIGVAVDEALASRMASASHEDQVAHYVASIAQETSSFTDMRKIAVGKTLPAGGPSPVRLAEGAAADGDAGTDADTITGEGP
jgi:hypothetical protein